MTFNKKGHPDHFTSFSGHGSFQQYSGPNYNLHKAKYGLVSQAFDPVKRFSDLPPPYLQERPART